MRPLVLLFIASTIGPVFPHVISSPPTLSGHLEKRAVNVSSHAGQDTPTPPRKGSKGYKSSSQSTSARPVLPSYPESITNPVDPSSWLMEFARSAKVAPYWHFTETLWQPCQRHRQPIPSSEACVPTCDDIYSHTHLALFTGYCGINVPICTFATFVLPDELCPGRVNSYKLRCPDSIEQFNKIKYDVQNSRDRGPYYERAPISLFLTQIEAGTLPPPSQCKVLNPTIEDTTMNTRSLPRISHSKPPKRRNPHGEATPTPHASKLLKRDYKHRRYLDSKGLYRMYSIEGPRLPLPNRPNSINRPFDCYDAEAMASAERVYLNNVTLPVEICWYAVGTKDIPEERCPGIRTPDSCPQNDEELVEAIMAFGKLVNAPSFSEREDVIRLLEVAIAREEPFCDVEDKSCAGPEENGIDTTPYYPTTFDDIRS
ncbi:hypothetical protein BJ508DRAFT_330234 [Ascobolus immersus RN42]|uniref:Uncharacterized protein n=1 Tax=Ascobolus immersus RN42 TaxID=1160509 RepID=A0A3N4HZL3_ASCIM|nr:hypothetical protein BJ508DRAFT_330234 [Ascobolus immersus RN42]